ncbi:MAG: sigma-54-dependent Fis family transcriptional regulator [Rhizobacter sp.]|nr:sigma-54-dependent Fis family transcriptional regulator [Chlorobiales bacterium]
MNTILVIDDERVITDFIKEALAEESYTVEAANSGMEGLAAARRLLPDLVILDYMMPDLDGLSVLRELRKIDESVQVMMVTAFNSVPAALEAIKLGATDYIIKPFNIDELKVAVAKALEQINLRNQIRFLRDDVAKKSGDSEFIICVSAQMGKVYELASQVAHTNDTTVLILGESGAGKEHLAKFVHLNSARKSKPFVELNCAAIPDSLLESELFGYEPGAFTDARSKKQGLFEYADGGTIFLDEIGDMPQATQAKVLKIMETKTFRRVGGLRDIKSDVRIVAATNKDLAVEIERGNFREDLYYRLQVVPIEIPPLRQRPDDILQLANFFIEMFVRSMRKRLELSNEAAAALIGYKWKGNVRELKNVIERAVIITPNNSKILPEHLSIKPANGGTSHQASPLYKSPLPVQAQAPAHAAAHPLPDTPEPPPEKIQEGFSLRQLLDRTEQAYLVKALEQTSGNQLRAAKLLGIERHVLRYQMKKHGIEESKS